MARAKNKGRARTSAKKPARKTHPRRKAAKARPIDTVRPVRGAIAFAAFAIPLTDTPCPRCLDLYKREKIRGETVMPMPEGAFAPMEMYEPKKCCRDCAAADTLIRIGLIGKAARDDDSDRETAFIMARIAVGNDRQEQLRMPGMPLGLVGQGLVAPCVDGDFDRHHTWLKRHGIDPRYPQFIEGGNTYE